MNNHEVAKLARDTCRESLKNPHHTHEQTSEAVYDAVLDALNGKPCVRCGNLLGGYAHGPGFCIDRRRDPLENTI